MGLSIFHLEEVVLVSAITALLSLSSIVLNFHIVVVYNSFYALYGTVTYFNFVSIEYAIVNVVLGECRSNRLKKNFPIFVETFLLNECSITIYIGGKSKIIR